MLTWVNGRRTDNSFEKLLDLLKDTPIGQYYTDDWVAYSKASAKQYAHYGKRPNLEN